MLLSMTGFGEARHRGENLNLAIELRAVNNRYLKVTVRGSEPYPMLEPELEKTIRKYIKRGTILVHVRCERQYRPGDFQINQVALQSYLEQVGKVCDSMGWQDRSHMLLSQVLALPGVASEPGMMGRPADEEWRLVEKTLEAALENLQKMRSEEGRAMADELHLHRNVIADQLGRIRAHFPTVAEHYRNRIRDRVNQALRENQVEVGKDELIREVAIFAERSDVSEEVMRLTSHLDQFRDIVDKEIDGPGRKLEFLTQEMFREANTIGSKAGDVVISRGVVDIKASLEKIRELVQNVE